MHSFIQTCIFQKKKSRIS